MVIVNGPGASTPETITVLILSCTCIPLSLFFSPSPLAPQLSGNGLAATDSIKFVDVTGDCASAATTSIVTGKVAFVSATSLTIPIRTVNVGYYGVCYLLSMPILSDALLDRSHSHYLC